MRTRRPMIAACAVAAAAVAIAGCGEVSNTIVPRPGTATHVKLELAGPPNALYAGVYDAIALGYYKQSDMTVDIVTPSAGQDPLTLLHTYRAEIAVSSEPNVLLRRNENVPIVAVGAIVQQPLASVTVKLPHAGTKGTTGHGKAKPATSGGSKIGKTTKSGGVTNYRGSCCTTPTTTSATTTTLQDIYKPLTVDQGAGPTTNVTVPKDAIKLLEAKTTPTYNGLVFVVRRGSIVNNAPVLRRFLQTAARGYRAARANPAQAVQNMISLVPALASQKADLLATLKAFLPDMFPAIPTNTIDKGKPQPWGWQDTTDWNTFGNWLHIHHLITDPQAVTDASTNELLAGKGI